MYPVSIIGRRIERDTKIFEELFDVCQPDVCVLDNLASLTHLEENSVNSMKEALDVIKLWSHERKIAFIIVHHDKKNSTGSSIGGMRGSGHIGAFVDAHIGLDETDGRRSLKFTLRHGEPVEPLSVSMDKETLWFETSNHVVNVSDYNVKIKSILSTLNAPISQGDLVSLLITRFRGSDRAWRERLSLGQEAGYIESSKDGKEVLWKLKAK